MHLAFFGRTRHKQVEQLYSELSAPLLAYARSLGVDHGGAEDVVHRTFLTLLEIRQMPGEPRPYLFRSVRNACLNQHRDHARFRDLQEQEPWFDYADQASELDLRRSLAQLPEEQREVLMLHIWGGLTFGETASALEISANTAASRYRYALAALKDTLMPKEKA